MAIDGALMVRSQQYFPIVPEPIDTVASQMCFGKTSLQVSTSRTFVRYVQHILIYVRLCRHYLPQKPQQVERHHENGQLEI
jgi:hypothetical protein